MQKVDPIGEGGQSGEDNLRKKKTTGITVNGVDLIELQRRKNSSTKEKVKTTPGRKKTLMKTTPSKKPGHILKYVTRLNKKTEDNPGIEDDRSVENHIQEDNLNIMKTTQNFVCVRTWSRITMR